MNGNIGDDVDFFLYYKDSITGDIKLQQYQGVWIIVDNGYLNESITVPPSKTTQYKDEMAWSSWLELVRNDVECTFGVLKKRFTILSNATRLGSLEAMDDVWTTCCSLHNMLIDYDDTDSDDLEQGDDVPNHNWENIINLQQNTLNAEHNVLEDDLFVDEINDTADGTYPNGSNIIPLKKLQLKEFKKRLVKHHAICKRFQQVHWK